MSGLGAYILLGVNYRQVGGRRRWGLSAKVRSNTQPLILTDKIQTSHTGQPQKELMIQPELPYKPYWIHLKTIAVQELELYVSMGSVIQKHPRNQSTAKKEKSTAYVQVRLFVYIATGMSLEAHRGLERTHTAQRSRARIQKTHHSSAHAHERDSQ